MERGQNEVTDRIRSAIKKKLTQMNSFVDDELPEYIMILIANKRSKVQIEKDLSLFLGSETAEFSQWLYELLSSLKVSSTGSTVSPATLKGNGGNENSSQNNIVLDVEDCDVLALDPQELESDSLSQELNSEEVSASAISSTYTEEKQLATKREPILVIKSEPSIEQRFTIKENLRNPFPPKAAKVYPVQKVVRMPICSTVVPVKRVQTEFADDEYDPLNPCVNNLASVVRVTERKYSVPAALQANKLLLRAMDDATKSVLGGKDINEYYKPTPIQVLTSDRHDNVLNKPMARTKEFKILTDPRAYIEFGSTNSVDYCSDEMDTMNFEVGTKEVVYQTPPLTQVQRSIHHDHAPSNENERYISVDIARPPQEITDKEQSGINNMESQDSDAPHFIVTLEGVDMKSFKRKRTVSKQSSQFQEDEFSCGEEDYDNNYDDNEDILSCDDAVEVESPVKKQKLNEKCRYWPACKSGDLCSYHHPTAACKLFPNCKYGGKCLYIHPNCKFDALCSRKDCPYTHASKRKLPLGVPSVVPVHKRSTTKTICKYFPNCTSKKCPFVHPKLCWYGRDCQSSKCTYSHLNVPSRNQMKWHA